MRWRYIYAVIWKELSKCLNVGARNHTHIPGEWEIHLAFVKCEKCEFWKGKMKTKQTKNQDHRCLLRQMSFRKEQIKIMEGLKINFLENILVQYPLVSLFMWVEIAILQFDFLWHGGVTVTQTYSAIGQANKTKREIKISLKIWLIFACHSHEFIF